MIILDISLGKILKYVKYGCLSRLKISVHGWISSDVLFS